MWPEMVEIIMKCKKVIKINKFNAFRVKTIFDSFRNQIMQICI